MTFKVDVSSIYNVAQKQNSRFDLGEIQDFSQHLGLNEHNNSIPKVIESEVEQSLLSDVIASQPSTSNIEQVFAAKQDQNQSGIHGQIQPAAELYPFTWHATAHLSYIQHAYADGTLLESKGSEQVLPMISMQHITHNTSNLSLESFNISQDLLTQSYCDYPFKESRLTKSSDSAAAYVLFSHYLPEKWPMRRMQITQQGQDIQVLIRDYQLTDTEIDHLTTEILTHMSLQGASPERILVNGRSVWKA